KFIEARDCSPEELAIQEINAAIYVVDSEFLEPSIQKLGNSNALQESYLTDIVGQAAEEGQTSSALMLTDEKEIQGVNTRYELALVNRSLAEKRNRELIDSGVEMLDPSSVYDEPGCSTAKGVVIGLNVQIRGTSVIERDAVIDGTAIIIVSKIGAAAHLKLGVHIEGSRSEEHTSELQSRENLV